MKASCAIVLPVLLSFAAAATASATSLYFQGFESDTSGWAPNTSGTSAGSIRRVASGGGTLGLTAFDGSYYAEADKQP